MVGLSQSGDGVLNMVNSYVKNRCLVALDTDSLFCDGVSIAVGRDSGCSVAGEQLLATDNVSILLSGNELTVR